MRMQTAKSRYQRRQMRMRAKFWRALFSPARAFAEGFRRGLRGVRP